MAVMKTYINGQWVILDAGNADTVDGKHASDLVLQTEVSTAVTANTIAKRDSSGRIKAAAPSANDDVVIKSTFDAHANSTSNPHNTTAAQVGAIPNTNGSVTDTYIGNRTIDQATATVYSNTGTLTQILSWFGKVIKGITGKTNWYDTPATTLESANTHINATTGIHGAVSTATADKLVVRDSAGRAQFADPLNIADAATKNYVDAHTGDSTIHVTSSDKTNWNSKAAGTHVHSAADITTGTMATARLPVASTTAQGIVQLDSSVASASTSTAATSSAVKSAYDLAAGKANATHTHAIADITNLTSTLAGKSDTNHNHTLDALSNVTITSNTIGEILVWSGTAWINNTLSEAGIAAKSHTHVAADLPDGTTSAKGIVQLSTSTSSTSTTLAATPSAVKAAYDLANGKADSNIRTDSTKALYAEVRTSDPASPGIGQVWFRSDL